MEEEYRCQFVSHAAQHEYNSGVGKDACDKRLSAAIESRYDRTEAGLSRWTFDACAMSLGPPLDILSAKLFSATRSDILTSMRMLIYLVAVCGTVLVSALPGLARASEWEVIKEREGIVVSRRLVEGRGLPQLRSIGEVPGTPYEVLAILLDVPAHVSWLPDCVESTTVREIDTWRNIIYSRTNAPWPVSDREVVLENEIIFVDPPTKVKVTFTAIAAPDVERGRGTVRMPMVTGFYEIEAVDDASSRIHYEVDADLGGSLPDWLVKRHSTKNPFETITGLRRRLEETRGQYETTIASFPTTE